MPEPLWKIRQRKQMTVNQLAAKSGVPAISISEYESGRAIRGADLPKLARALYVEEWDIEITGSPLPRRKGPKPLSSPGAREPRHAKPTRPAPARTPPLARPGQINHLLTLATCHFGKDREALEKEIGKALEEMSRQEATDLLNHYQEQLSKPLSPEESSVQRAKRKRAYLPESVDEFELEYLTAQQQAEVSLHFTLFDGQKLSGRIVGFGPYSITIHESETGQNVTLQKLAIAYYRVGEKP